MLPLSDIFLEELLDSLRLRLFAAVNLAHIFFGFLDRLLRRSEHQGTLDNVGAVQMLPKLIGADKHRSVVFFCRSGRRSGRALEALEDMGYTGIFNGTGYTALKATRP